MASTFPSSFSQKYIHPISLLEENPESYNPQRIRIIFMNKTEHITNPADTTPTKDDSRLVFLPTLANPGFQHIGGTV